MKKKKSKISKGKNSQGKKAKPIQEFDLSQMTLLELAELEKNVPIEQRRKPDGSGLKYIKQLFTLWLTIPDVFRGSTQRIEDLGITDPTMLAMVQIPSQKAFGDRYNMPDSSLSRWSEQIQESSDFFGVVKAQMKKLTKNVMGALYMNVKKAGNAAEAKLWNELVEDWKQHLGIDHAGSIDTLSSEEKAALDKLLNKNTA